MKNPLPFLICMIIMFTAKAQTFHNNGIAVNQLASEIFIKYDKNKDKIINVSQETFLRTEIGEAKDVIKSESRGLLFTNADTAGNKDGLVTEKELYNYISTFDEDNDSEITSYINFFRSLFGGKSEWTKFNNKYEERVGYKSKK